MPNNEKEYNGYLFDQLHTLQRLKKVAKKNNYEEMLEAIEEEEGFVKDKLYQKPPLSE